MADLQKGTTFSDTSPNNAVNAARLHQLVEGAVILPSFIGNKPDAGAAVGGDYLPILQNSSGQLRKLAVSAITDAVTTAVLAQVPTPEDAKVLVQNTKPDVAHSTTSYVWIKSGMGLATGNGGVRLWDDVNSVWRRVRTVPLGTVTGYVGPTDSTRFDGTGLGVNSMAGWARCNGNNTTATVADSGSVTYIQFIGFPAET